MEKNKKAHAPNTKRGSFQGWSSKNAEYIKSKLIESGIYFLEEHAERLKLPLSDLLLDDRWHYLDKAKKESYRARMSVNSNGTPYLSLTYKTFRHGGFSSHFDCREAIKSLWLNERDNNIRYRPVKNKLPTKPQKAIKSIDYIAKDETLWESLNGIGESDYLKRKGLAQSTLPGFRFGRRFIAINIIDTEQNFFGLQKIYNNGDKFFTKGLQKKGHFGLIGSTELPKSLPHVHICEGAATACSIYLATGEPVFVALDAGNLFPVGKNLKKKYKNSKLVFWADNDFQKANKKNKFGEVLGNTGLIHANRSAFKIRNSMVCTPSFDALSEHALKTHNPTDFNDLHTLMGIETLQAIKPQQPDLALALWFDHKTYNKIAHGVISPKQFTEGQKIRYTERYLPQNIFKRAGVHLVRSAIGTGKTETVEKFIKAHPDKSVLFTTHLISLVESAANRLNLTSYNECDNYDLQIEHRLAICLNSLGKLTREGNVPNYDIVIIDEIEQVLSRLTTPIENKPLIFSVLSHVIQKAKIVLCLDAHVSKITANFVQRLVPEKSVTVHFNEYEAGKNKEICFHDHQESVQMAAIHALKKDQTVFLAFNAKKEAFKTFCTMKAALENKKGLYISSDNAGDKEVKAFFENVNKASKKYDYIICTPSVSTGVSIDNGHFDFVGGIFNAQVNTANDCMQALGRVRNHNKLHVFCEKRKALKPLDAKTISSKWTSTHLHDIGLMQLNDEGEKILLNADYEAITVLVTQNRNRSFNDFYASFAVLALHDGIKLSYAENHLNDEKDKKSFREFKALATEQNQEEGILELSIEKLNQLANKPRKTLQETIAFKKKQITDFYRLKPTEELEIEQLSKMDEEGRFRKKVTMLELALSDKEYAENKFLKQLEVGQQFAADLTYYVTLQDLFKQLLKSLNAIDARGSLLMNATHYSGETLLKSEFFEFLEKNRSRLSGVINIPPSFILKQHPIRFISQVLSKMGLKQKRVGKSENATYVLCAERLTLLKAITNKRKEPFALHHIPVDETLLDKVKGFGKTLLNEGLGRVRALFDIPLTKAPAP